MSAYGVLLRNRNYRLWFTTAFLAGIGDWTGLFALQVIVTTFTEAGSRLELFALGGVMMARLLPSLLLGPVAGVLADRYDRKRLMVFTNALRGGLYVVAALSDSLATLFTLVFVIETMSLLFLATKDATLPVLVRRDHLTQANQLNLLVTYGTLPLGALVGSVMIPVASMLRGLGVPAGLTPPLLALLVTAVAFGLAALTLSRLVLSSGLRRARPEGTETSVLEELRAGLHFIRGLPLIRSLILGVIGVFFSAGAVIAIGPAFVQTSLGASSADWFTLMTLVGVGLVTGVALVPFVLRFASKERAFPAALGVAALLVIVTAALPSFGITLVFGFLLGTAVGMSFVMGYTLLHEYVDDEVRARTFAAFYTGTRIALFASLGLAPFVAGAVGRGTVILGGWSVTMSGIRLTIMAAGVFAMLCVLAAGRGMGRSRADRDGDRTVSLPDWASAGPSTGIFIAFEGVEGAGKSTQVARLADSLRAEGYDVVVTREPGGAPISERIRSLLLDPSTGPMDPRTEALLLTAARVEHVHQVIQPALEAGRVVVCDRYIDSSRAYQGHARGLGDADVFEINRWAIGGLLPDVVVLLYLDPAEGLRRVATRPAERHDTPEVRAADRGATGPGEGDRAEAGHGGAPLYGDRLERESLEFHQLVAEGFLRIAKRERGRYRIIDAGSDPDTVARQIRTELLGWLPRRDDGSGRERAAAGKDVDATQPLPADGATDRPLADGPGTP